MRWEELEGQNNSRIVIRRKGKFEWTSSRIHTTQKHCWVEKEQGEVKSYLYETHSDKERETTFGTLPKGCRRRTTNKRIRNEKPTWKEICEVEEKERTWSAHGYSGEPYKFYKKNPKKTIAAINPNTIWKRGHSWRMTDDRGCFLPKEKDQKTFQLRTISLLNVEGKIYFSVLANRMTTYMVDNSYIDTSM